MLSYPATIPLSSRTLNHLAERIRGHRKQRRSRWRRLNLGVATAWRYVQEARALLATAADDLATAMQRIGRLAYAILDDTLIPIDRVADQRPYYSGKHQRHGVNVQVIADAAGRLVWASPALPGSVHDLTAARTHGIIEALSRAEVMTFADKGYQGARGSVHTPFKRRRLSAQAVTPAEGREPGPREDPRPRRTGDRHTQDLENPGQAALLPTASDHDRAGHPRAAPRRSQPLRRMKKAVNRLHRDAGEDYEIGGCPRPRCARSHCDCFMIRSCSSEDRVAAHARRCRLSTTRSVRGYPSEL
jgi:hypothetical protein